MLTLGPLSAPLVDRTCSANGTSFEMKPSARNGAKSRAVDRGLVGLAAVSGSTRARLLGRSTCIAGDMAGAGRLYELKTISLVETEPAASR